MALLISSHRVCSRLIENTVITFFQSHPLEVYRGQITTKDVLSEVFGAFMQYRLLPYEGWQDETLDFVRVYGPEHERDREWLRRWGGKAVICPDCPVQYRPLASELGVIA